MGIKFNPFTGNLDIAGADGAPGADGSGWITGSGAPDGALGRVDDLYLDTDTGDYYLKTGSSTWTLQGSLKGADAGVNLDGGAPDSNYGGIDPTDGGGP